MYVAEGSSISIPQDIPVKNCTADILRRKLDEFAGLSRLTMDSGTDVSGFKGRPSFRDLMAFTFQPQNIVANPNVLFFKADSYEHREKLRAIFPYVLNAITPQVLAAQHELEIVRRELARKSRELENLQTLSERWNAELRATAIHARELGVVSESIPPNASRDELIDVLQRAVAQEQHDSPTTAGVEEAVSELVSLQQEERQIDQHLRTLNRRLAEMTRLKEASEKYVGAMGVQRDRLELSRWLREMVDVSHVCPVCNSSVDTARTAIGNSSML